MDLIYTKYHIVIAQRSMDNDFWQTKFLYFIKKLTFQNRIDLLVFIKKEFGFTDNEMRNNKITLNSNAEYFELSSDRIRTLNISSNLADWRIKEGGDKLICWSGSSFVFWENGDEYYFFIHEIMGVGEITGKMQLNQKQKEAYLKEGKHYIEFLWKDIIDNWRKSPPQ